MQALEQELAHDCTDDRINDDDWWAERRWSYAQLFCLCAKHKCRTYITLPPSRADTDTAQLQHIGGRAWVEEDLREDYINIERKYDLYPKVTCRSARALANT